MPNFQYNINYIITQFARVSRKRLSFTEVGNILGVKKLTIFNWVNGRTIPKINTLYDVCSRINEYLDWNLTPQELLNDDVSKKYNVDKIVSEIDDITVKSYSTNIEDVYEIGKRLRALRKDHGWTYMDVSLKSKKIFPHDKEFQISHTHVMAMENGTTSNYNIQKLRSLATIYNKPVEYIIFGWEGYDKVFIDRGRKIIVIPMSKEISDLPDKELITYTKHSVSFLLQMVSDFKNNVSKELN